MKNILGGKAGEGKQAHKTKSNRKIITLQEWAGYFGVHRYTILNRLKKYKLLFKYDPKDIYSVFDFFKYLLREKNESGN
jgi:hypothetical protein